ncbi:efflux RND transporter periplasmic adaptor subunit [Rhizobium sp. KVB221]|uniref:Efflux RND transporter periplasmic adaptor subunit n=1 Tax=Rhizobium setariae TaxID=2801340 RepID=A0A936YRH9_9HYPH|nr:efflux RND transporter periplasmic adaptor subunit [Rhizobium setariae]MBL0375403.1 efflux RND transporter periplasmic adaptor subunit [Rhizobium setariae]
MRNWLISTLPGLFLCLLPLSVLAQDAAAPPPVTVAKPVIRDVVDNDEFVGRFESVDEVSVRARVGGYLQEVHFTDGMLVKKGDLLFVIDQRPYAIALEQADAELQSAEATVTYAAAQLKRAERLVKSGGQTVETLDERRREWISAQASVRAAQATADRAKLDLEYTKITAPIDGRIDRALISAGNLIQADQSILTTIVTLDPIDFYFDVDERRLLNFARTARGRGDDLQVGGGGVEVRVTIADSDEKPFTGKLDFAENRIDRETGTMRLRARLDNPQLILQPGLFGRVEVEASNTYRAILIPDESIGSDQNERVVYVVGADGSVSAKPVRLGSRLHGYRLIHDGLDGSETIVVNGLMRARPGSKVTPKLIELPQTREGAVPDAVDLELAQ